MKVLSLSALCPQSGKDTLADYIQQSDGLKIRRIAFGDALRKHIKCIFGSTKHFSGDLIAEMLTCSAKDVEHEFFSINKIKDSGYRDFMWRYVGFDPQAITQPRSLRYHLQRYGNDYMKSHLGRTYYWIDTVINKLKLWEEHEIDLVIVTDTRAPEEFDALNREFDTHNILVRRVGFPVKPEELKRIPHPIEDFAKTFHYDWELDNVYGDKSAMFADFENVFQTYIKPH